MGWYCCTAFKSFYLKGFQKLRRVYLDFTAAVCLVLMFLKKQKGCCPFTDVDSMVSIGKLLCYSK